MKTRKTIAASRSAKPMALSTDDAHVIRKVLASSVLRNAIGAEEWDLTEDEEMRLWKIINREGR